MSVLHQGPSSSSSRRDAPAEPANLAPCPVDVPKTVIESEQSVATAKNIESEIAKLGPHKRELSIGRGSKNDIQIKDPKMSERHAMIYMDADGSLYILDGQPLDVQVSRKIRRGTSIPCDLNDVRPGDHFKVEGGFEFTYKTPSALKPQYFWSEEEKLGARLAVMEPSEYLTVGHQKKADFEFSKKEGADSFKLTFTKQLDGSISVSTITPSTHGVKVRTANGKYTVDKAAKLNPGDWVTIGATHFMVPYNDSMAPKLVCYHGSRQKIGTDGLLPSNFDQTEPGAKRSLEFAEYIAAGLELLNSGHAKEALIHFYNHSALEGFGVPVEQTNKIKVDLRYESRLRAALKDLVEGNLYMPAAKGNAHKACMIGISYASGTSPTPGLPEPDQAALNSFYHEATIGTLCGVWLPALRATVGRPLCEFGCFDVVKESPRLDAFITLVQQHVMFSELSATRIACNDKYQTLNVSTPAEDALAVAEKIKDLLPSQEITLGRKGEVRIDTGKYPTISRYHASIAFYPVGDEQRYRVVDTHSEHGTFIQRAGEDWIQLEPGEPEFVHSGDKIRLHNFEFIV